MVPAVVFDGTAAEAELWRIGENLMRKELTDLERAEQIARRIGLTEEQSRRRKLRPLMRIVTTKGEFAKLHANSVLSGAHASGALAGSIVTAGSGASSPTIPDATPSAVTNHPSHRRRPLFGGGGGFCLVVGGRTGRF